MGKRPETIKVHKLKDKVVLYYIDDNTGSTQGIDLSYPAYEALKRHYDTGALEVCTDENSGLTINYKKRGAQRNDFYNVLAGEAYC